MSLAREFMLELMAYADGELDAENAARVETKLAVEASAGRMEAQAFLDSLSSLGEVMRTVYEDSPDARAVASSDVVDAVMARVEASSSPPIAAPIGLAAARARRADRTKLVAVVGALAAAAAAVLFLRVRNEPAQRAGADLPDAAAPVATESRGVEVDAIDSPSSQVSVFYLPAGGSNASSVVVWIDDPGGP